MTIKAVLFDLDGTLVDSNEMHVLAWEQAFAEAGHPIDRATIHEQIGKGADMLVPALLPQANDALLERLATRHGEVFKGEYLDKVRPFDRAHDLLARVHAAGLKVVLASSASAQELDHYIDLLDAGDLVAATTSADDVEKTKPAPDIFATALKKLPSLDASEAIVVGDTPYDMEAAARCGVAGVAVRSGKFPDEALTGAGAVALYDDVAALLAAFDASPLGG